MGSFFHAESQPCAHCGALPTGTAKVFLDRLPLGGFKGGLMLEPVGVPPPEIKPDFPGQTDFDEKEILPES